MADNLPSEFYETIDRKNWTVNVIQHGLRIDNELYTTIYTAIETEMRSQNILGHKLNQSLVKKQLKLLLADIILRFSTTFDAIPYLWREKCLMAIAQKCNYNMRRSIRRRTTLSAGFLTIHRMAIRKPYGLAIWFAPYMVIWFRMAIRPFI